MLHCVLGVEFASQTLTIRVGMLSSDMADERRYRYKAQYRHGHAAGILSFSRSTDVDSNCMFCLILASGPWQSPSTKCTIPYVLYIESLY